MVMVVGNKEGRQVSRPGYFDVRSQTTDCRPQWSGRCHLLPCQPIHAGSYAARSHSSLTQQPCTLLIHLWVATEGTPTVAVAAVAACSIRNMVP